MWRLSIRDFSRRSIGAIPLEKNGSKVEQSDLIDRKENELFKIWKTEKEKEYASVCLRASACECVYECVCERKKMCMNERERVKERVKE